MAKITETTEAKVLSNDQKLRIVLAHRDFIRADAARISAATALNHVVDIIGKELGVEPGTYDLDIESLALTAKKV